MHAPSKIQKKWPAINKKVIGGETLPEGTLFSTDAISFSDTLGIPTIPSFCPDLIKLTHSPDEYIGVEDIINTAKIYALATVEYLNEWTVMFG